jgi:hypothetical protein
VSIPFVVRHDLLISLGFERSIAVCLRRIWTALGGGHAFHPSLGTVADAVQVTICPLPTVRHLSSPSHSRNDSCHPRRAVVSLSGTDMQTGRATASLCPRTTASTDSLLTTNNQRIVQAQHQVKEKFQTHPNSLLSALTGLAAK